MACLFSFARFPVLSTQVNETVKRAILYGALVLTGTRMFCNHKLRVRFPYAPLFNKKGDNL